MEIDRSYALIHLNNIIHNYNLIKSLVGQTKIMAVVKADAYGHGSVSVAKILEQNGCNFFAVSALKEAIELRKNGILGDILIFGKTLATNYKYLVEYNLIQTVHTLEYAKSLNKVKLPLRIHLNIDTGMSRFGFYLHNEVNLNKISAEISEIYKMDNLLLEGIYTHFANSDEEKSDFYIRQFELFKKLLLELDKFNIGPLIKHAANSAATILHPETYLDMVRVGIAMYGYPPVKTDLNFLPVMEVFARVIAIRDISESDTVSYGRTYKPNTQERIATLAIGYGDGYNRQLSNQDYLVYKNKKLPVIGRVCMGLIMVKIGDIDINEDDYVEVFGYNKDLKLICKLLNTIPYEPLCNISKRVKRVYINS